MNRNVLCMQIGEKAPEFTLPDQNGQPRSLKDYRGKWLLIFFYPKDMTPGCTKEACGLRDYYGDIQRAGAEVVGVSVDPISRHEKFIAKHDLPFTLLSDEDREVVQKYGVWGEKKFMGKTYMGTNRVSFLIDPEGDIAKIYTKVKPAEHAEEVLEDLSALN